MMQPSFFDADARLGLVVDHRRLLSAIGEGWLRPLEGSAGHFLGVGNCVREASPSNSRHPIHVHLTLSASKLPDLEIHIFRASKWVNGHLQDLFSADGLFWPGALPTFAISSLSVSTEEERTRLIGMTRSVSNVDLSEIRIDVVDEFDDRPSATEPPADLTAGLVVPDVEDSIRGAMTMALWAVPRIGPWLDVLQASLPPEQKRLASATKAVDAAWWRFVPWHLPNEQPDSLHDHLWLAAIGTFQVECMARASRPRELAQRIADHTMRIDCTGHDDAVDKWLDDTLRILRTETTIQFQSWRQNPVGLAVQLVLTRPEPTAFKTWFKEVPSLPPAVAWSAATLCGLLSGYKRLDTRFRGCALQRELLSIEALSAAAPTLTNIPWPSGRLELRWHRKADAFVLSHGEKEFARKAKQVRGRWHEANFEDAEVRRAAATAAERLHWECVEKEVAWDAKPEAPYPQNLDKRVRFERGKVRLRIPRDATIEQTVDVDRFRRLVATEIGEISPPPGPVIYTEDTDAAVPGLTYLPNFLSEVEECELIELIDKQIWSEELKRRVQHYGWRYDYKARHIDSSMELGPLPPWAAKLAQRLFDQKLVPQVPDQVIVNEYQGRQGIAKHMDAESSFADGIAMVSLADSWEMTFQDIRNRKHSVNQLLERRSVAVVQKDARYRWTHEIRPRKTEPPLVKGGKRRPRKRRISLTFRKVLATAPT